MNWTHLYYWLLENAEPRFAQDWADESKNYGSKMLRYDFLDEPCINLCRVSANKISKSTKQVTEYSWANMHERFWDYAYKRDLLYEEVPEGFIWFEGEERPLKF